MSTAFGGPTRTGPKPEHPGYADGEWIACPVTLPNGISYECYVDARMEDPLSRLFLDGHGGYADPHLVELMLALAIPGAPIVDLGSFLGMFSLAAAGAGYEVLAVDASPQNVALLTASAVRNRFPALRVVNAAVAASAGTVTFEPNGPFGQVVTELQSTNSGFERVRLNAVRVDQLVEALGWKLIGFVKLDVEGFEIEALKGMKILLEADGAPPVLFESNGHTLLRYGLTPEDLFDALAELGYEVYYVFGRRLIRVRPSDFQPLTVAECLAFKGTPAVPGWPVDPAMSAEEMAQMLATEAAGGILDHRRYLARALKSAGRQLLAQPAIIETLKSFRTDPNQSVRDAVGWWKPDDLVVDEDPVLDRPAGKSDGNAATAPTLEDRLVAERELFQQSERSLKALWQANDRLTKELEAAVDHLRRATHEVEELRNTLAQRPHLGPRGTALAQYWLTAAARFPRAARLGRLGVHTLFSFRAAVRRLGAQRRS